MDIHVTYNPNFRQLANSFNNTYCFQAFMLSCEKKIDNLICDS